MLISPRVSTRISVGRNIGSVTSRNRCHAVAPSTSLASSTSSFMFCRPARNISMNVPDVVHTTSVMITTIATDGPENQSHQDRLKNSCRAQPGAESTPTTPSAWWKTPRESAVQLGPWMPT